MEAVYLFLTSVGMDAGAREYKHGCFSERKRNKYTDSNPYEDNLII
ncbi:MAG: hypothetical protein FWD38_10295 [Oscillospiraceae bacterium]|nr:hypothetical protein [Oscillospiraceae bacterium]